MVEGERGRRGPRTGERQDKLRENLVSIPVSRGPTCGGTQRGRETSLKSPSDAQKPNEKNLLGSQIRANANNSLHFCCIYDASGSILCSLCIIMHSIFTAALRDKCFYYYDCFPDEEIEAERS